MKKLLKLTLAGAILLVLALFIFSRFEGWRGHKAWQETADQLKAQGIPLDWNLYIPEAIPDSENLAMARVMTGCYRPSGKWTETGNWQETALFDKEADQTAQHLAQLYTLKNDKGFGHLYRCLESPDENTFIQLEESIAPYLTTLQELREACATHPKSYLPGDYSVAFASPIPNFSVVRSATRFLYAESALALHSGQAERVIENCKAMHRVANLNPQVPLLVNVMIENVVWRSHITEAFAAGIEQDAFDSEQLERVIEQCRSIDLIRRLGRAMEVEFVASIDGMFDFLEAPVETMQMFGSQGTPLLLGPESTHINDTLAKFLWYITPTKGWNLQMISRYAEFLPEYFDAINRKDGTIRIDRFNAMQEALDEMVSETSLFDNYIALAVPSYSRVSEVALDGQRRVDLITIAAMLCLESNQGKPLPDTLSELADTLPSDPETQRHYDYKKEENGFTLSSPGIDAAYGTDDDLLLTWTGSM